MNTPTQEKKHLKNDKYLHFFLPSLKTNHFYLYFSAMHIISITCLALVAFATADFPVEVKAPAPDARNDDTAYRVPEDIDPIHYVVEITPYFEVEGNKEAFTFDGIVTLTFRVSKITEEILSNLRTYLSSLLFIFIFSF